MSLLLSFQWGIFCALRAYSEGSVSAGTDLLVYSIVFYNSASSESMGIDQKGNNTDWPTAYKDAAVELRNQRRRERHREGAAPVMERGEPGERGGGRVHLERQLSNFQGKEGVKMGQIWDNFFEMCAIDIVEGVRRGWVEEDEVRLGARSEARSEAERPPTRSEAKRRARHARTSDNETSSANNARTHRWRRSPLPSSSARPPASRSTACCGRSASSGPRTCRRSAAGATPYGSGTTVTTQTSGACARAIPRGQPRGHFCDLPTTPHTTPHAPSP